MPSWFVQLKMKRKVGVDSKLGMGTALNKGEW